MEDHGLSYDKANTSYPRSAEEFLAEIDTYKSMIKSLIQQGVYNEVKDEQVAVDNLF